MENSGQPAAAGAGHGHDANGGEVSFARDLGLFDATMIGVGAMIGAGIFVLTGIACGVAGPAAILAFGLNGAVTLLTAFSYAELASAIPEAGGGYSYIKKAFPAWVSFVTGWMLWFAYTVACSLYALGFSSYFWELGHEYFPAFTETMQHALTFWPGSHLAVVTLAIGILFIALNVRGAAVTGKAENILTVTKVIVLAIFCGFGLVKIFTDPDGMMRVVENAFTPFFANGAGGVIVAMGLTFIAFEGYDLIATVSEEIQEPTKNIPKAIFLSLGIAIITYILIIFVSLAATGVQEGMPAWQFLGAKGETGIVEAAQSFMPKFGVALIVFGGLLSTMSALNATVLASSRVAFTMGRDRLLPKSLSAIHPIRRTPHVAIIASGAILLVIAVAFNVKVVGSAASVMFLLVFTMVNLTVLALRKERDLQRGYKIPFYPWPPLLGVLTSIFLAVYQVNLGLDGIRSWGITLVWIVIGLTIYFIFFRKSAVYLEPQTLVPEEQLDAKEKPAAKFRILLALYNRHNVGALMNHAAALCKPFGRDAEIVAVTVVGVPTQLEISEGLKYLDERRHVLGLAREEAKKLDVRLRTEIRISHKPALALVRLARDEHAHLLITGWKGFSRRQAYTYGSLVDRLIEEAPCDLLIARVGPADPFPYKKILLPTAGGPSAALAAKLAPFLLDEEGEFVLAGVTRPNADEETLKRMKENVSATMAEVPFEMPSSRKHLMGGDVGLAVVEEAKQGGYDAICVGGAKVKWFKRVLLGKVPERIAVASRGPVLMFKKFEGAKSVISPFLGED